jgi:hypothetical protein
MPPPHSASASALLFSSFQPAHSSLLLCLIRVMNFIIIVWFTAIIYF